MSSGIALLPTIEEFKIDEAVAFAVKCITVTQSRIPILYECNDIELTKMYIATDKQWLKESILCLLSNAVKFTEVGEVKLVLKVVSSDKEQLVLVEVVDSGIGVPAHLKPKLFKAFQQVKRYAGDATQHHTGVPPFDESNVCVLTV